MSHITLIPTQFRQYKSAKAVRADWDANKDFRIADMFHPDNGRVINKQDAAGLTLNIRYDGLRKVVVIKEPAK